MSEAAPRDVCPGDVARITEIYAGHVLHGTASLEEIPPTQAEMAGRIDAVIAAGYPWLVATLDGRVAGYAYASQHKARSAYRYTAEDSIYLAPEHQGKGIGRALLGALLTRCTALGMRQMIAVIGGSDNTGSINLHRAMGFTRIGIARDLGHKFGRPVDVVYMQRALVSP